MTRVVIFRASDRPEVGAALHLPVAADAVWSPDQRPVVLRTVCGLYGIGSTYDDRDASCAMCQALSGQHPGGHGKRYLTRWHRTTHPRREETP